MVQGVGLRIVAGMAGSLNINGTLQNYSISKRVIVAIAAIANNCFSEDEGGTRADDSGGHWMIID